jgi:hypothetical protein
MYPINPNYTLFRSCSNCNIILKLQEIVGFNVAYGGKTHSSAVAQLNHS